MTPGVITVSALNSNLTGIASYSNYGAEVDFCAPGSSVNSAIPNTDGSSGYASYSGTSFSAPYVAAVCANIKSMNTDLTKAQVYDIMTDLPLITATAGLIHIMAAVCPISAILHIKTTITAYHCHKVI